MRKKKDRTGEVIECKNGQKATIIKYENNKNITVRFEKFGNKEEKEQVTTYSNLMKRSKKTAKEPSISYKIRIGETRIMNNKQKATITEYFSYSNITVKFEDDTIKRKVRYSSFIKGSVKNPNYNPFKEKRLGETNVMYNGQKATIIEYYDNLNIIVKFEDGHKKETDYNSFKRGLVRNPYYIRYYRTKKIREKRIGETRIMNNGMKATIINYLNNENITLKFENGTIKNEVKYSNFKKNMVSL